MKKVLVIGASGFVGGNLAKKLLAEGYSVRCLARTPDKIQNLANDGCEVVQGDIADLQSVKDATKDVNAVYISIQTVAAQPGSSSSTNFIDVELAGVQNILEACKQNHVSQIIYVSFLGVSPHAKSSWIKGRWEAEQLLLNSGLNATIIRPGMIVGIGGQGFGAVLANAKKSTAMIMGKGKQKFQCIAIGDLIYYLVGVLDNPEAFGKAYDVGGEELYTMDEMIDMVADIQKNPHPKKFHIPMGIFKTFSFIVEPMLKMQKGAIKGLVDSMKVDLIGNGEEAIAKILPRKLLPFKQAASLAIENI